MSKFTELSPPEWPVKLLRFFLKKEYVEEIEGDMEELFFIHLEEVSLRKARLKYTWEMIRLLRPSLIKNLKNTYTLNPLIMYRNYLKTAWRNLMNKKAYSAINIFGLALGIACCLLIFMFVQDELSFDNYHEKGDRIYRVVHGNKDQSIEDFWVWGNAPIGQALADNFPEIEKICQFSGRADFMFANGEKKYQEEDVFLTDSTVFDVFSWKLLKGNPKTALAAPFSVVLTESTAHKYFGDEDPLGKSLKSDGAAGRANGGEYLVTGVMEDVPSNSHFRFNALVSMSTFRKSRPDIFTAWGYVDFYTYFLVNDQFDRAKFEAKIPSFINKQMAGDPNSKYKIVIEPLKDVYLRAYSQRQPGETGSLPNIYLFSIIGVFILVIAIINFMNLSTARSMERSKEVGIRKSIGANRGSLIYQFLSESFIIVVISMMAALIIVYAALPAMGNFTGKVFFIQKFINTQTSVIILGMMVLIGLAAGSYPSFVLSSFNPVKVLKGMSKSGRSGTNLRRVLVVFQFSLSIALIAGTLIVYFQMNHVLDKNLGFDKERQLILDYNYDGAVNDKREALRTEMGAIPSVVSSAFTRSVPGGYFPNAGTGIETADGEFKYFGQAIFQVGKDFIPHFNLKLVAGRSYSAEHPTDTTGGIVINEATARQYGYKNPSDIIGKRYEQWGRKGEVIGVVADFNFTSLHNKVEPLTLPMSPYDCRFMTLKIKSNNIAATIEQVEQVWNRLAPHRPFIYSFLDDDFNRQYKTDFTFRQLFTTFSCLAILIASLGLLGLATYTAEQRTKEIGIRKVLGANVNSIVALLSKDFVLLVLVSMLIATPPAWYVMNKWLEGFAYRMEIQPWIFVLAGLAALSIAIGTISYQSIRAALVNPVNSLRSE